MVRAFSSLEMRLVMLPHSRAGDAERSPASVYLARQIMRDGRTWPYSVVKPDNQATPGKHNVRAPDGYVVFSDGVDAKTAKEACEALNKRWDEAGF